MNSTENDLSFWFCFAWGVLPFGLNPRRKQFFLGLPGKIVWHQQRWSTMDANRTQVAVYTCLRNMSQPQIMEMRKQPRTWGAHTGQRHWAVGLPLDFHFLVPNSGLVPVSYRLLLAWQWVLFGHLCMFRKGRGRQGGRELSHILKWRLHAKTWISCFFWATRRVSTGPSYPRGWATNYSWVKETPAIFFKQTWSLVPSPLYPRNISASFPYCFTPTYLPGPLTSSVVAKPCYSCSLNSISLSSISH